MNKKKNPCPHPSSHKCEDQNPDKCKYDKRTCKIRLEQKEQLKTDSTRYRIWLFIIGAALVLVTSILWLNSTQCQNKAVIFGFISGLCASIFSGAIILYAIDIPSKLKQYQQSFLSALTSDSYIGTLSVQELTNMRIKTTQLLHAKDAPNMAEGLIKLDQNICNLLMEPYYEWYRQQTICDSSTLGDNYIHKVNILDFRIINPFGKAKPIDYTIHMSNLILAKSHDQQSIPEEAYKKFISINNFTITDSKGLKTPYSIILHQDKLNLTEEYYDTKVKWGVEKNPDGIPVQIHEYIDVRIEMTVETPVADCCYTKRLSLPAKNFRLDFTYPGNDKIKLHGQIFGTEIRQSDVKTNYITDNTISIETFALLLPKNGAIIVINKKE